MAEMVVVMVVLGHDAQLEHPLQCSWQASGTGRDCLQHICQHQRHAAQPALQATKLKRLLLMPKWLNPWHRLSGCPKVLCCVQRAVWM